MPTALGIAAVPAHATAGRRCVMRADSGAYVRNAVLTVEGAPAVRLHGVATDARLELTDDPMLTATLGGVRWHGAVELSSVWLAPRKRNVLGRWLTPKGGAYQGRDGSRFRIRFEPPAGVVSNARLERSFPCGALAWPKDPRRFVFGMMAASPPTVTVLAHELDAPDEPFTLFDRKGGKAVATVVAGTPISAEDPVGEWVRIRVSDDLAAAQGWVRDAVVSERHAGDGSFVGEAAFGVDTESRIPGPNWTCFKKTHVVVHGDEAVRVGTIEAGARFPAQKEPGGRLSIWGVRVGPDGPDVEVTDPDGAGCRPLSPEERFESVAP